MFGWVRDALEPHLRCHEHRLLVALFSQSFLAVRELREAAAAGDVFLLLQAEEAGFLPSRTAEELLTNAARGGSAAVIAQLWRQTGKAAEERAGRRLRRIFAV